MRSPILRLTLCLGLLALAACDKKKAPTEPDGRVIEREHTPATAALQAAPLTSPRVG